MRNQLPPIVNLMLGVENPCPQCGGELTHGHHFPGYDEQHPDPDTAVDDLGLPLEEDTRMAPRPEELDLLPTCSGPCACHGDSSYIGNPARAHVKVPAPNPGLPVEDDDDE